MGDTTGAELRQRILARLHNPMFLSCCILTSVDMRTPETALNSYRDAIQMIKTGRLCFELKNVNNVRMLRFAEAGVHSSNAIETPFDVILEHNPDLKNWMDQIYNNEMLMKNLFQKKPNSGAGDTTLYDQRNVDIGRLIMNSHEAVFGEAKLGKLLYFLNALLIRAYSRSAEEGGNVSNDIYHLKNLVMNVEKKIYGNYT